MVVTGACGGRDHLAMQRVLDDFRFSPDALLTDTAAITPLLAAGPPVMMIRDHSPASHRYRAQHTIRARLAP